MRKCEVDSHELSSCATDANCIRLHIVSLCDLPGHSGEVRTHVLTYVSSSGASKGKGSIY